MAVYLEQDSVHLWVSQETGISMEYITPRRDGSHLAFSFFGHSLKLISPTSHLQFLYDFRGVMTFLGESGFRDLKRGKGFL